MIAGTPSLIIGTPMVAVLLVMRFRYLKDYSAFKDNFLLFIRVGIASHCRAYDARRSHRESAFIEMPKFSEVFRLS